MLEEQALKYRIIKNFFKLTWRKLHYFKLLLKNNTIVEIDILLFLRQLSTLLISGISLHNSLEILEKIQNKQGMQRLIYDIKRELLNGKPLYHALGIYPAYFNFMTCQLIRLAENVGKLDVILKQLADYKEKQFNDKRKLKQILFYPCLILIFSCCMTLGMFIFVIPHFAKLFEQTTTQLPVITRFIFYLSKLIQQLFLPFISIFLIALTLVIKSKYRKIIYEKFKFKILILLFKTFFFRIQLIQFLQQLILMHSSGMTMMNALQLSEEMAFDTSASLKHEISLLKFYVASGMSLYQAFLNIKQFPPFLIEMVKVGEETGQLELMLSKVNEFLQSDIERTLKRYTELLEPLIMLLLGVLIGALVIGMYLPIFKLGTII